MPKHVCAPSPFVVPSSMLGCIMGDVNGRGNFGVDAKGNPFGLDVGSHEEGAGLLWHPLHLN